MASAAVHPSLAHTPFGNDSQQYTQPPLVSASKHTSSTKPYSPRDIIGTVNYFKDNEDGSPPAPSYVGRPETYFRPPVPRQVVIRDIRGAEEQHTLDTSGFQVVRHESVEKEFVDEERIKEVYYPEVEEVLKKATGASKVFIFDHTIRRPAPDRAADPQADLLRGPVQRVHIDQSYRAGPERVKYHLPSEADTLLRGRYQVINLWRPIKTIRKDPLAVCEASSVAEEDLVPIKLIYPNREGETFSVRANEAHKWHYYFGQTPEDVLLIKCFDSKTDGRARRVPHTAFVDEEFEGGVGRESIEVRALVFHPEDTE